MVLTREELAAAQPPDDSAGAYMISVASYVEGAYVVSCPSTDGWKTRAARLIGDGLRCRYVRRSNGYIANPSKLRKFVQLYADGWDASSFTGELCAPVKEG